MANPTLRFKRGSQSAFASVGLQTGEPSFITDESNFFIGSDGTNGNNKFFGSSRYWVKETTSQGGGVKVYGSHAVGVAGTGISILAPNSVGTAVTYTLPVTPIDTFFLKTNSSGDLSWSNEFPGGTFSEITTFTDTTDSHTVNTGAVQIDGGLGVNKNVNIGANIDVTGISTFRGVTFVTDSTDSDTFTSGALIVQGGVGVGKNLNVGGNVQVTGISTFVGAVTFKGGTINIGDENTDNINVGGEFVSNLTPSDNALYDIGDASQTKNWRHASFSGVGTFATGVVVDAIQISITTEGKIDTSTGGLTLDSASGQTTIDDNLSVTGISTFTGAIDANGGADISGGETTLSSATVSDLTSGRVVLAGTLGSLEDSSSLTFGAGGLIVGANGLNVTGVSTFSTDLVVGGDIRINGNDIQASDGATNVTLTSSTLTTFAGDIKVTGNDIQASDGNINITMTSNTLTEVKGDLKVTGNDIQSSSGIVAITLAGNDVTIADDLTVEGNLFVNGSTTQVNTAALTVEDRTIDLGIVNGAAPATDTTWDLGILFNYYSAAVAKKSAVIWEHADARFKFASVAGADTDGTDVDTPQLTVTTFAPIEIAELWVNNACTGGTQQVIVCSGAELQLQNIVIDGGVF